MSVGWTVRRRPGRRPVGSASRTCGCWPAWRLRSGSSCDSGPIRQVMRSGIAGQQRLIARLRARLPEDTDLADGGAAPDRGRRCAPGMPSSTGTGWSVAVEAETVLDDLQATERRLSLKVRDGGIERVILLVADTRRNRRALDAAPGAFAAFSRDGRRIAGRSRGRPAARSQRDRDPVRVRLSGVTGWRPRAASRIGAAEVSPGRRPSRRS